MLHQINEMTECDCFNENLCTNDTGGYTVGIAAIQSLESFEPRLPGDPELIMSFAETTRHRWNLGHCGDDALVVLCTTCERVSKLELLLELWYYAILELLLLQSFLIRANF